MCLAIDSQKAKNVAVVLGETASTSPALELCAPGPFKNYISPFQVCVT